MTIPARIVAMKKIQEQEVQLISCIQSTMTEIAAPTILKKQQQKVRVM
jgi:hypothetical protein